MESAELEAAIVALVNGPQYRPLKPRVIATRLGLDDPEGRVAVRRTVKQLVRRGTLAFGSQHMVISPARASALPSGKKTSSKVSAGQQPTGKKAAAPRSTTGAAQQRREASTDLPSPDAEQLPSAKPTRTRREQPPTDATPADKPGKTTKPPRDERPRARGENVIVGTFRRHERGFGFVRPQKDDGTYVGDRDASVYIPADGCGDASTGDVVAVRVSTRRTGPRGGPAGTIVEILERETHQFVGTYFENRGQAYVQVDGKIFSSPVAVGDPGAKNAQVDDKVVFEMVRFPSHAHDGEGVILEVLGARGQPGVDTLTILREFAIEQDFSEEALEQARQQAAEFNEEITPDRTDFTGETVITIDPVDARDFDDAISLTQLPNGHWLLGVHIADVSHFVPAGTPLDREAYQRATSVYLPDKVVPMLPELISNGLASLQPDRVRYTRTAMLEFTPQGVRTHVDLHAGAIRSARRFTYEEVDDYLAQPDAWQTKLTPAVHRLLGQMHELAMILRQRRLKRGAIELTLQEVKVDLDREGRVCGAHRVESTVSHQIIEEFMLAANDAVAETLAGAGMKFLRRVHAAPDPRKMKALSEFVAELGLRTPSLEDRFELQKLLARVHGQPTEHAVNYAVLRSFAQAVYSPHEEGHYALASECYCHFTSPIRRYPDLTVHRLIEARLRGRKKSGEDFGQLLVWGRHCSDRERRAESAERELTKLKLLAYMNERVGEELDAVITGVEPFGLFAEGLEIPAEGMVHISQLADDSYEYQRQSHTLRGRRWGKEFRLGDRIRVVVARVDLDRRELDYRLAENGQGPPPAGGRRRERAPVPRPAGKAKSGRDSKQSGRGDQPAPRGRRAKRR